jgi:hypothetical protein
MFNMITLLDCQDVKETLQQLRSVYSYVYSTHCNKLLAEAKTISPQLNKAAISAKLKEIYQGPSFDEEESYLAVWQRLAGSGLSAEDYLQRFADTLNVDELHDANSYLQALATQQRQLKAVNFIAINNGDRIAGFIIYHILEKDNETFFQVRQSAMSSELITQLVAVLISNHPYAVFEANKANANTLPVLNALHKAQLAALQATLHSYKSDNNRFYTTKNGMTLFKPNNQDTTYPNHTNASETLYRRFISVG